MTAIHRFLLSGIACAAGLVASIGLAGPVSAEVPSGSYNATDPSGGLPSLRPWVLTPCGPTCVNVQTAGTQNFDLHDQGNGLWTGAHTFKASTCQDSLEIATMTITNTCSDGGAPGTPSLTILTKIG